MSRFSTAFKMHRRRLTKYRKTCRRILSYRDRPHILYCLTPPPNMANIGDHAQVVAIRRWLKTHFADWPVLELDKNEVLHCLPEIKASTRQGDPVFLHSGGNLGDRGLLSETGRRMIIGSLHHSPIVSLPQTIFFSDTDRGRSECLVSQEIYNSHPQLLVAGRDEQSGRLAARLFPNATTLAVPDFVLSLPPVKPESLPGTNGVRGERVLACLRRDNESAIGEHGRARLLDLLGDSCERFDTTVSQPITSDQHEPLLRQTLEYFSGFDVVVTDRYHGLIFSVLCGRPTVVLRTVDHKLTSALEWFSEIPTVRLASSLAAVPALIDELKRTAPGARSDWGERHFTPFAEVVHRFLASKASRVPMSA